MTEAAPLSKDRKSKTLIVPLSYESVNQYKKALMFLYEFQSTQRSIEWPSPKRTKDLIDIIKEYERNLVYDQREMFSISARHHMLLRDQDPRNLNFADCFCTIIPKKQHRGTQQVVGLVFCLDKGKTLKEGESSSAD
ncbi:hypothetical protein INT45_012610 [Circinella minor]|uniref:Uncharacterized protein n=1 Tax=Circinella minor TaxID=1195481 RepID=A0A8H7VG01_9FUNG|nr:hypothetical protein INT45_012610 [Circinella minor]